jgi:hypothetical protein
MADKHALGMIGLMLGAATMFVATVGAVVVGSYADRLNAQSSAAVMATLPAAGR